LNEQERVSLRRCVGQEFDVLFEKQGRFDGQLIGRSPYLQPVQVAAGGHKIGDIARVRVVQAMTHSLTAELVLDAAHAAEAVA
jgi:tRNA-2-methylthio-N6-dimethylallyladenosine synthase